MVMHVSSLVSLPLSCRHVALYDCCCGGERTARLGTYRHSQQCFFRVQHIFVAASCVRDTQSISARVSLEEARRLMQALSSC